MLPEAGSCFMVRTFLSGALRYAASCGAWPAVRQAGLGMDSVLKTTVLLKNIADFGKMNEVYATYFDGIYPARAAFQVGALPKNALVEIEVVAGE